MIATTDPLTAARATALFVSELPATGHLSRTEVEAAIRHALRTHGGTRGCAADMAATYGDYPELAAPRMRWARRVVGNLYHRRPRQVIGVGPDGTVTGRHSHRLLEPLALHAPYDKTLIPVIQGRNLYR